MEFNRQDFFKLHRTTVLTNMRIFQVVTHFDIGGAERVAINIVKSKSLDFTYHLFEVVKGDTDFSSALKKEFQENGIQYHCSPFKNRKLAISLFWIWFIKDYLKYKPEVIHAHTEVPDLALWVFRKLAWIFFWMKPKYARTIHNTQLWNEWGKLGDIVESYYLKYNCNIAISTSTRDSYVKRFGGTPPPVIYNGLEEAEQQKFPYLIQGKINILFAGRLEYQKGIDELITVVIALKEDSRFHFTIVGNGSMEHKMKKAFIGINNVSMYEKVFGLSHFLNSFDYLFMPSNHEGLALMPIEASLAHTPTIINSCPGLKDTMPPNWKLSVNDNSIPDFIDIIANKISTYVYDELAEEAYQFASKCFALDTMQNKYEKIYDELSKA